MAIISGITAARMLDIEANSIVDGTVDPAGNLILTTHNGVEINAGNVEGPSGADGSSMLIPEKLFSAPPSSYPTGVSQFTYTTQGGWPTAFGTVFTFIVSIARGFQIISEKGTDKIWFRNVGQDDWTAFYRIATTAYVDAAVLSASTAANDYTDSGLLTMIDYVDDGDLAERAYADAGDLAARNYADSLKYPEFSVEIADATIASGVVDDLNLAASPLSPANGYVLDGTTTWVIVPSEGTYLVACRYDYNTNVGTGRAFVELVVENVSQYRYASSYNTTTFARVPTGSGEDQGAAIGLVGLNANAKVGANALQSSGASRAVVGILTIQRIS